MRVEGGLDRIPASPEAVIHLGARLSVSSEASLHLRTSRIPDGSEIRLDFPKVGALAPVGLETMEDLSHFFPSMSLFQDLREALRLEPPRNACVEFPVNILNHIGHCGVVLKKLLISFERRMVTRKLLYRGIVTRGVACG